MTSLRRFRRRLRFRFDTLVSRGAGPIVGLLALVTVASIIVFASIAVVVGVRNSDHEELSPLEAGWSALMRTLDPGTMGGDRGWGFRLLGLAATLTGIFLVSILIGVITTSIDGRLERLRKGRSVVDLSGHTVILGWSQAIGTLVAELAEANANQRRSAVAIVAAHDKEWMEQQFELARGRNPHMLIVCRTGDPSDPRDVDIVGVRTAKIVVVLAEGSDESDANAVRATLAVVNSAPDYLGPVIVEMSDGDLATALSEATEQRAITVTSRDVIARVTAQVCRFRGMSHVYQELLDFAGDEIYVEEELSLVGHTYATAVVSYEHSSVMGIRRADGRIELSPPPDQRFAPGDAVIAISEDDDTVTVSSLEEILISSLDDRIELPRPTPLRLLIVGWHTDADRLLRSLCRTLPPGSHVQVCSNVAVVIDLDSVLPAGGPPADIAITTRVVDIDHRAGLQQVLAEAPVDNVLLLCDRAGGPVQDDSRNLIRLLNTRQIIRQLGQTDTTIITELRDVADVALAGDAGDDFIVSEGITSLLLAQLSENPDLRHVFAELFDPRRVDLTMVRASSFGLVGEHRYGDVVRSLLPHGSCIGWEHLGEVVVNPPKNSVISADEHLDLIVLVRVEHQEVNTIPAGIRANVDEPVGTRSPDDRSMRN